MRRCPPFPDLEAMASDWCDECGARHSPERRRAIIRRMLPCRASEIAEEWTCIYPDYRKGSASAQMLYRDLLDLGAYPLRDGHATWGLLGRRDCYGCGHRHGGRAYGVCLEPGCDCVEVVGRPAAEAA